MYRFASAQAPLPLRERGWGEGDNPPRKQAPPLPRPLSHEGRGENARTPRAANLVASSEPLSPGGRGVQERGAGRPQVGSPSPPTPLPRGERGGRTYTSRRVSGGLASSPSPLVERGWAHVGCRWQPTPSRARAKRRSGLGRGGHDASQVRAPSPPAPLPPGEREERAGNRGIELIPTSSAHFTALDYAHMARALRLAERGLFTTQPNPRVGCVIARGAEVLGEGWHIRAGGPHAEVHEV
jgi:hypothetical protein